MEQADKRDVRCGTTCHLLFDGIDHCAYCQVEDGIGPYGWELSPMPKDD